MSRSIRFHSVYAPQSNKTVKISEPMAGTSAGRCFKNKIGSKQNRMKCYICRKCHNFSLFYQRTKSFSFLDFLCRCQNSFCFSLSALNTISITFTPVLFFVCSFITTVHIAEVYKHTIEGSETDMENYGQEVRRAIRLSRVRVMRSKNRQKILSERTKDKQFNYFHYP